MGEEERNKDTDDNTKNPFYREVLEDWNEEFHDADYIDLWDKIETTKLYKYINDTLLKQKINNDTQKQQLLNALNVIMPALKSIITTHNKSIDKTSTKYDKKYDKKYHEKYKKNKKNFNTKKKLLDDLIEEINNRIKEVKVEEEEGEVGEEENVRPRSVSNKSLSVRSVVNKNLPPDYLDLGTNSSSSNYMTILPLSKVKSGGKRRITKRKRSIKRSNTKRSIKRKRSKRNTKRSIKRSNTKT